MSCVAFLIGGFYLAEVMRINKYLSKCGYCSRREADRLLEEGQILVNGRIPELGQKVSDEDEVRVKGQLLSPVEEEIVIAYHKPAGVVSTLRKKEENTLANQLNLKERVYPVGRLDKESTGLMILTNNGDLMNQILRGKNMHEKEYVVRVNKPVRLEVYQAMEQGVPILDTMTRPCKITNRGEKEFHIILTQGLNRQIRRMCDYFDLRVLSLKRIRIMNIHLGDLKEGSWRYLTREELGELKKMCGLK